MSERNVEIVRRIWEGVQEDPTEFPMSLVDPEILYEDDILPDHVGETYRGHEEALKAAGLPE
jgi:hypothetical protein